MIIAGGVMLLALLMSACSGIGSMLGGSSDEPGGDGQATPTTGDLALVSALPGTWKRVDAEVYNTFTPDGSYSVENRETEGADIKGANYHVLDESRIRFELADGSSFVLDVNMLDDDTLVYYYTPDDSVTFVREASTAATPAGETPPAVLTSGSGVTVEPGASASAGATVTPRGFEPVPALVAFDDFSEVESGWPEGETDEHAYGYQDGAYHIAVFSENLLYHISAPGIEAGDVIVEVDAKRIDGTDTEMGAAVMCRVQDEANDFYVFEVTFDGYYTVAKYIDGSPESLGIGYQQSPAINVEEDATNHIRVDCVGDTLVLYVNGTRLTTLQDDSLTEGRVALATSTFQNKPFADVLFDNFLVTAPPE